MFCLKVAIEERDTETRSYRCAWETETRFYRCAWDTEIRSYRCAWDTETRSYRWNKYEQQVKLSGDF